MKIAVAADGSVRDSAVLAWAAWFARSGDDIHVVHAYQELSVAGSAWLPAVRANDHRRYEARRIVTAAESTLHAALHGSRRVSIGGSAIAGWPHQVLADMSSIADLLIIGTRVPRGRACAIDAVCPVVVVPTGWTTTQSRGRSVAVLSGRDLPTAAMDRAVDYAQRAGTSVLVVRTDDVAVDTASDLERLDLQVAGWQRPAGPPIVTEIRHNGIREGMRSLAHVIGLLVIHAAEPLDTDAIRFALDELAIPVVLCKTSHSSIDRVQQSDAVLAR